MNRVVLSGRVGQDPKIYNFDNGKLARFSLATTEKGYKTKSGREVEPETTWHNISVGLPGLAGVVEQHVRKGSLLIVCGRIMERAYTSGDGSQRKTYEINADSIEIMSWPERNDEVKETIIPNQDDLPF